MAVKPSAVGAFEKLLRQIDGGAEGDVCTLGDGYVSHGTKVAAASENFEKARSSALPKRMPPSGHAHSHHPRRR